MFFFDNAKNISMCRSISSHMLLFNFKSDTLCFWHCQVVWKFSTHKLITNAQNVFLLFLEIHALIKSWIVTPFPILPDKARVHRASLQATSFSQAACKLALCTRCTHSVAACKNTLEKVELQATLHAPCRLLSELACKLATFTHSRLYTSG